MEAAAAQGRASSREVLQRSTKALTRDVFAQVLILRGFKSSKSEVLILRELRAAIAEVFILLLLVPDSTLLPQAVAKAGSPPQRHGTQTFAPKHGSRAGSDDALGRGRLIRCSLVSVIERGKDASGAAREKKGAEAPGAGEGREKQITLSKNMREYSILSSG